MLHLITHVRVVIRKFCVVNWVSKFSFSLLQCARTHGTIASKTHWNAILVFSLQICVWNCMTIRILNEIFDWKRQRCVTVDFLVLLEIENVQIDFSVICTFSLLQIKYILLWKYGNLIEKHRQIDRDAERIVYDFTARYVWCNGIKMAVAERNSNLMLWALSSLALAKWPTL